VRRLLLLLGAALALAALGGAALVALLSQRTDLSRYQRYLLPPAPESSGPGRVTVSFLGVATLVFSDGDTLLMTDGWFTRVGLLDLLRGRPVAPDLEAIERGLERVGIANLLALLPVHSHYDHAQDAGEVARRTGALLLGSRTTAWIGRGAGLPEEQIRVVEPGVPMRLGAFTVTHVPSRHVRLPFGAGALGVELAAPLVPPVPASAYVEGGSWSILIEHPLGTALVQGSAGFVEGVLERYRADAVFLGVGGLARQGEAYSERYFREIVEAVGARQVIPIHYDDLTAPTDGPLVPMPALVDDVAKSFDRLIARAAATPGLEFALLPYWETTVLFEGS
jgi:L-ascorbate metabolism protein UlaG (beta-lactamase superfamily)